MTPVFSPGGTPLGSTSSTATPQGHTASAGTPLGNTPDRLLARTIRRQLKADPATSDLSVRVSVRHGVVHCHAYIDNLGDPDNMEAVMQRIPGVRGLIEELDLAS